MRKKWVEQMEQGILEPHLAQVPAVPPLFHHVLYLHAGSRGWSAGQSEWTRRAGKNAGCIHHGHSTARLPETVLPPPQKSSLPALRRTEKPRPVLRLMPTPRPRLSRPGILAALEKPALSASMNEARIMPALASSSWFHAMEACPFQPDASPVPTRTPRLERREWTVEASTLS